VKGKSSDDAAFVECFTVKTSGRGRGSGMLKARGKRRVLENSRE
jgi:hypothetical protein